MQLKNLLLGIFLTSLIPYVTCAQDSGDSYGYVQKTQPAPVKRYCQTLQLKDDPELTDNERFELYYEEHRRVQKEKERIKQEKNNAGSLDDICKDLGIKRNPGKKK